MKRLYRSRKERILGGVCGGFGEHIDVDPSILRLVCVVLVLFTWGLFLLVYIAAWIIVPEAPEVSTQQTTLTEG
jgi:phage shock protein C